MWRLALAAVPVAALALALAGGVASQTDTPTPTPEPSPSGSPSPPPSPPPSPEPSVTPEVLPPLPPAPLDPNAAQSPPSLDPAYPGSLRPGDWVQITGTDSCLNMRSQPLVPTPQPDGTTYNNVLNCLPDGFIGRLDTSTWSSMTVPVLSEGRWWWQIVGQGWAADEFLAFHHQGGIPWPERADLANAGLIAYIGRDNNIWVMNGDGSGQRPLVIRANETEYFYSLAWSPSGDRLSFTVNCCGSPVAATRILDPNGNLIVELMGLTGAEWSPDGTRVSALHYHSAAGLGNNSTPVVFDLNAGTETAVGPASYLDSAPAWSPDGQFVSFVCMSTVGYSTAADGSSVETRLDCGGDGLRIVSADGTSSRVVLPIAAESGMAYRSPSWSPDGRFIALANHWAEVGCRGNVLLSVESAEIVACFPVPPAGGMGGRCGGPEDMASDWTPDGSKLIYHTEFGAGRNGVFIVDVATGGEQLIAFAPAWHVSVSPDGEHLTFGGANYIWVAGTDGSNLTPLAEGHAPAWQPRP